MTINQTIAALPILTNAAKGRLPNRPAKPAKKAAKPAAEKFDRAEVEAAIAAAKEFTTYLRVSPTMKLFNGHPTLAAAANAAFAIRKAHKGRNALVCAIHGEAKTSTPIPAEIWEAAAPAPAAPAKAPAKAKGKVAAPKAAKAAKRPAKAAAAPKAAKATPKGGKRAEIAAAAAKGILPTAPDFSAETHKRFRGKLAEVVALVEAGNVKALKAFAINPISTSPKAIDKYRNLAVIALEAKAA